MNVRKKDHLNAAETFSSREDYASRYFISRKYILKSCDLEDERKKSIDCKLIFLLPDRDAASKINKIDNKNVITMLIINHNKSPEIKINHQESPTTHR